MYSMIDVPRRRGRQTDRYEDDVPGRRPRCSVWFHDVWPLSLDVWPLSLLRQRPHVAHVSTDKSLNYGRRSRSTRATDSHSNIHTRQPARNRCTIRPHDNKHTLPWVPQVLELSWAAGRVILSTLARNTPREVPEGAIFASFTK